MIRTQVQLTKQQVVGLRRMAAVQGVSMAAVVRKLVDIGLASDGPDRSRLFDKAASLIGSFNDPKGASDLSSEHDAYLAGERR